MRKKIISWGLLIIWMGVIFSFSSMVSDNSTNTSYKLTDVIVSIISKENKTDEVTRGNINFVIRKSAHFTEYLILAILTFNVLSLYPLAMRKKIIICILFGLLYAISDEYHQIYVSGRTAQLRDIIIDFMGVLIGTLGFYKLKEKK